MLHVNSFQVEYEYAGILEGAGLDPKGHIVPATTYPYFQSVRDTILDSIATYAVEPGSAEASLGSVAGKRYRSQAITDHRARPGATASATVEHRRIRG
jgi:hypothetical protein